MTDSFPKYLELQYLFLVFYDFKGEIRKKWKISKSYGTQSSLMIPLIHFFINHWGTKEGDSLFQCNTTETHIS